MINNFENIWDDFDVLLIILKAKENLILLSHLYHLIIKKKTDFGIFEALTLFMISRSRYLASNFCRGYQP